MLAVPGQQVVDSVCGRACDVYARRVFLQLSRPLLKRKTLGRQRWGVVSPDVRWFLAQHCDQVSGARIATQLREQGCDLTAMMCLMVEEMGDCPPEGKLVRLAAAL